MGKFRHIWYTDEGYSINLKLSQFDDDSKYKGFSASCQYRYDKEANKYILRMWLVHNTIDGMFKLDHEGIDTQYISGSRDTIRENICRIVEQMMTNKLFDEYIDRYEYDMKCWDKGIEVMDNEECPA